MATKLLMFRDATLFGGKSLNMWKVLLCLAFCVQVWALKVDGLESKHYFASKTRYYYEENPHTVLETKKPDGCSPLHISMVIRHGTRNPSKKDVRKINNMLHTVNGLFTANNPFKIGDLVLPWENHFTDEMDKALTETGKQELYNMSERIRTRYPELIETAKYFENFHFVSTNTSRCLQSAEAFVNGFFEGNDNVTIETHDIDNDPVLRFFDMCPKYKSKVSGNKSALYEHHKFKESQEMKEVVRHVRETLGYLDDSVITTKHVIGMYIACTFEVAVFDRMDTWCSLFRLEDFLVMEYFYDLKHYWKRGYGYDVSYEISCVLLQRIISYIKGSVDYGNANKLAGVFHFAHAETLQPLYGVLGLFKDENKLLADNFSKQKQRQYRTSKISPFGANVAFVVYNCTDEGSMKLQVLVNEQPVTLPCCEQELCPLSKFFSCYKRTLENCSLEELCELSHNKKISIHYDL